MKVLGHALLVLGTIVASLGGAKLPTASVAVSGAGLALLLAAIVCLRWRTRTDADGTTALAADDPRTLLRQLPERLEALDRKAGELELEQLIGELDGLGAELLSPIADGAPPLLAELGTPRFAAIFGPFASAERAVARAWSAAADGHRTEALSALKVAVARAQTAVSALGE